MKDLVNQRVRIDEIDGFPGQIGRLGRRNALAGFGRSRFRRGRNLKGRQIVKTGQNGLAGGRTHDAAIAMSFEWTWLSYRWIRRPTTNAAESRFRSGKSGRLGTCPFVDTQNRRI